MLPLPLNYQKIRIVLTIVCILDNIFAILTIKVDIGFKSFSFISFNDTAD